MHEDKFCHCEIEHFGMAQVVNFLFWPINWRNGFYSIHLYWGHLVKSLVHLSANQTSVWNNICLWTQHHHMQQSWEKHAYLSVWIQSLPGLQWMPSLNIYWQYSTLETKCKDKRSGNSARSSVSSDTLTVQTNPTKDFHHKLSKPSSHLCIRSPVCRCSAVSKSRTTLNQYWMKV